MASARAGRPGISGSQGFFASWRAASTFGRNGLDADSFPYRTQHGVEGSKSNLKI
jgi:hypothetical protein